MAITVFDLFKIGIGPSSSHTVGPMRAARDVRRAAARRRAARRSTARVRAELFGSLGATGKGHGSDKAVLLGLEGETPETVDVDTVDDAAAPRSRETRHGSPLLGDARDRLRRSTRTCVLHRATLAAAHPNGMRFTALDAAGEPLRERTYYSVGGGFVVDEDAAGADRIKPDDTAAAATRSRTGDELLAHCARDRACRSPALMLENEKALAHRGGDPRRAAATSGR